MRSRSVISWTAAFLCFSLPVFAQSQGDSSIPTIPESQIQPRQFSSTYEFLSTADASSEFEILSSTMALKKSQSDEIKMLAQRMIDDHTRAQQALREAGKADQTEIAAPSPDGEQKGLLNKMEPVTGADFDRLYIESQIFAHQRAIAIFKGYQTNDNNLGRFAAKTLPTLVQHYAMVIEAANGMQATGAVQ